jgi:hypothetical protein
MIVMGMTAFAGLQAEGVLFHIEQWQNAKRFTQA